MSSYCTAKENPSRPWRAQEITIPQKDGLLLTIPCLLSMNARATDSTFLNEKAKSSYASRVRRTFDPSLSFATLLCTTTTIT